MAGEDLRRTALVAAGLAILGLLVLAGATQYFGETGAGPGGNGTIGDGTAGEGTTPTLVQPIPNGSELWPYTSRSRGFAGRTLAINVIAVGEADQVQREFRRQVDANWTTRSDPTVPANETAAANETATANETERVLEIADQEIVWQPAHGADRFGYVRTLDGPGTWLPESYQLYDGAYLGTRHHVRAYEAPAGDWTAMQAHREYWDWFRLRHTVTSTADTQRYVDDLFLDDVRTERVYKVHLRNDNGWATVIEFAGLLGLLVGLGGRGRLRNLVAVAREQAAAASPRSLGRPLALFGAVLTVYLGVRVGGVVLEGWFQGVSPKVIAGVLYPILAFGLPIAAYRGARTVPPEDAFAAVVAAVVVGFVLEYGYLELEVIPVDLLLHRVALVLALGLVAAAGASWRDDAGRPQLLALGVGGWVVGLGLPLLGLL